MECGPSFQRNSWICAESVNFSVFVRVLHGPLHSSKFVPASDSIRALLFAFYFQTLGSKYSCQRI